MKSFFAHRTMPVALLVVLGFLALAGTPSWGQTTGAFVGVVTDRSGSAVPGARITATNPETGLSRSAESNAQGEYVITLLPPNRYDIEVKAVGFEEYLTKGVTLLVNQTERVDISMTLGTVAEKVEVHGEATGVDTVSSTINQVITGPQVVNLPLNGRNFLQLATLVPGSVPGIQLSQNFTPTTAGSSSLSLPQVNGLRSQSNNVLLDGADDNEIFLGEAAAVPSPDSIQEFSIQTNLYAVEFGRGAGSIINVVTRSGTDTFHGSLYDYFRNDVLDARNFFALGKPELRRNQPGGSIGGPILKKRTHFFFSYEGLRLRQGITDTATVPTVLEKEGNFSQSAVKPIDPTTGLPFPGDQIPANEINPIAAKLLQFYPNPNVGTTLFTSSPTAPSTENKYLVRIDHELGGKDNLFGHYLEQGGHDTEPFTTSFAGTEDTGEFPLDDNWRYQHLVLSESHVFSPSMVNQFSFGFNRNALTGLNQAIQRNPADFGFTYPTTVPGLFPLFGIAGYTANGQTDMGPGFKTTNVFQWLDIWSYTRGRHTIKAGVDIRRNQMNSEIPSLMNGGFIFSGSITGNAVADFLLARPALFLQSGGNFSLGLRSSNFSFFGEDGISLSRKLKLTVGLRYELPTWPVDIRNRFAAFRPGQQSTVQPDAPLGLVFPGDSGIPDATVNNPKTDFAPRIGLAWDPFGNGKTSVRAGYGIFYDSIQWHNFLTLQISPPFSFFISYVDPTGGFADPTGGKDPFKPGLMQIPFSQIPLPIQFNVLNQNLATPYAQQYNLTLQHEIFSSWLLQAAYVGTTGVHLPSSYDANQAVFVPGATSPGNIEARRPFGPDFASIYTQATEFNSNYNALQLSINKRTTHGLTFLAAYTFSKAMDTISTPIFARQAAGEGQVPMDPNDFGLDHAVADFDATHRFVFSYLYELPRFRGDNRLMAKALSGWAINGIVQFQTGLPFTVTDNTDPRDLGRGFNQDRADLVGNPNAGPHTLAEWFNTTAFQRLVAPADHDGTAGRNINRGPGINNWDFSIVKNTKITERTNIEFRTEFFNLWNHPGFENPISDITSPNFGQVVDTRLGNERQIQLVLRLNF